jgi:NAD(P)-dependent dehydrogenase (short-subunit alcohol dehydrogenase family)
MDVNFLGHVEVTKALLPFLIKSKVVTGSVLRTNKFREGSSTWPALLATLLVWRRREGKRGRGRNKRGEGRGEKKREHKGREKKMATEEHSLDAVQERERKRERGRIKFLTGPFLGCYGASKGAMLQWTNAIRVELRDYGIATIIICPGGSPSSPSFPTSLPLSPLPPP